MTQCKIYIELNQGINWYKRDVAFNKLAKGKLGARNNKLMQSRCKMITK